MEKWKVMSQSEMDSLGQNSKYGSLLEAVHALRGKKVIEVTPHKWGHVDCEGCRNSIVVTGQRLGLPIGSKIKNGKVYLFPKSR